MFRWPLALTPLSLGSSGTTRDAILEITPRGAIFTLTALAHVGHPSHLAVIDAYLKGQTRLSGTAGIGEDSRLVASALAAPLVAAHELGIEHLGLADVTLLPPEDFLSQPPLPREAREQARGKADGLTRTPASPRFLLRAPGSPKRWLWVRAAEHFEVAGCVGTPHPGLGSRWHDLIVQLPDRPSSSAVLASTGRQPLLPPIDAELRQPTESHSPSAVLVRALRELGQARFARASGRLRVAADAAIHEIETAESAAVPLSLADLRAERRTASDNATLPPVADPAALATALDGPIARRQAVETVLNVRGGPICVSLAPDLNGYQTLCLLPPSHADQGAVFELMRAATWDMIEALIGRPLAERRTEPIALRLVAADGHTTTLDIGASVVIVRNQVVFTSWVGSDGRVMLKLFPPGGMPTR